MRLANVLAVSGCTTKPALKDAWEAAQVRGGPGWDPGLWIRLHHHWRHPRQSQFFVHFPLAKRYTKSSLANAPTAMAPVLQGTLRRCRTGLGNPSQEMAIMASRILALFALGILGLGFCFAPQMAAAADDAPKIDPQVAKALEPKLVTIKGNDLTLAKVLKSIQDQTGVEVQAEADEEKHNLDLNKVPFWKALDTIAKQWDLRVYLYGRERKVTLVKTRFREMPVDYPGLFRLVMKKIVLVRDLEDDTAGGIASLEVAWEPRFQGFYLESKTESLVVKDDKGLVLDLPRLDRGRSPTPEGIAMTIELPLPALSRKTARIGSISGTLTMIGSPKLLNFTFDKLAKGETQTQENVQVAIKNFIEGKELWTVDVSLKYPPGGPKFESFQTWLLNNQAYLVHNSGKRLEPAGYEADEQTGTVALLRYRFISEDQKGLGKPNEWKLVYRTPSAIVEVPIKFEFKDVPLP
jgi:hypothetical protein